MSFLESGVLEMTVPYSAAAVSPQDQVPEVESSGFYRLNFLFKLFTDDQPGVYNLESSLYRVKLLRPGEHRPMLPLRKTSQQVNRRKIYPFTRAQLVWV